MMKNRNLRRIKRHRQRRLNELYAKIVLANILLILMLIIASFVVEARGKNKIEDKSNSTINESIDHYTVTLSANVLTEETTVKEVEEHETTRFSRNLTEDDMYLLAKIAMAEAEGESFDTKVLVILTILNRVESKQFPNTIKEVIFQERNGVYQFSPTMPNGRWWNVEPNEECWKAVETVNATDCDVSKGALYFESCSGESWHSRNLELICESDNMRFYK